MRWHLAQISRGSISDFFPLWYCIRPSPRRSLHATGSMPFERRVRAFPGKRDMRGVVRGGRPSCCWPVGAPCGCSMSPRNVDVGRTLAARARASCHRAHRRSISKLRPRRARVAVAATTGSSKAPPCASAVLRDVEEVHVFKPGLIHRRDSVLCIVAVYTHKKYRRQHSTLPPHKGTAATTLHRPFETYI